MSDVSAPLNPLASGAPMPSIERKLADTLLLAGVSAQDVLAFSHEPDSLREWCGRVGASATFHGVKRAVENAAPGVVYEGCLSLAFPSGAQLVGIVSGVSLYSLRPESLELAQPVQDERLSESEATGKYTPGQVVTRSGAGMRRRYVVAASSNLHGYSVVALSGGPAGSGGSGSGDAEWQLDRDQTVAFSGAEAMRQMRMLDQYVRQARTWDSSFRQVNPDAHATGTWWFKVMSPEQLRAAVAAHPMLAQESKTETVSGVKGDCSVCGRLVSLTTASSGKYRADTHQAKKGGGLCAGSGELVKNVVRESKIDEWLGVGSTVFHVPELWMLHGGIRGGQWLAGELQRLGYKEGTEFRIGNPKRGFVSVAFFPQIHVSAAARDFFASIRSVDEIQKTEAWDGKTDWFALAQTKAVIDLGQIPSDQLRKLRAAVKAGTMGEVVDWNFPIHKRGYAAVGVELPRNVFNADVEESRKDEDDGAWRAARWTEIETEALAKLMRYVVGEGFPTRSVPGGIEVVTYVDFAPRTGHLGFDGKKTPVKWTIQVRRETPNSMHPEVVAVDDYRKKEYVYSEAPWSGHWAATVYDFFLGWVLRNVVWHPGMGAIRESVVDAAVASDLRGRGDAAGAAYAERFFGFRKIGRAYKLARSGEAGDHVKAVAMLRELRWKDDTIKTKLADKAGLIASKIDAAFKAAGPRVEPKKESSGTLAGDHAHANSLLSKWDGELRRLADEAGSTKTVAALKKFSVDVAKFVDEFGAETHTTSGKLGKIVLGFIDGHVSTSFVVSGIHDGFSNVRESLVGDLTYDIEVVLDATRIPDDPPTDAEVARVNWRGYVVKAQAGLETARKWLGRAFEDAADHPTESKKTEAQGNGPYPCPTCGRESMLSADDVRKHYQCYICTAAEEFGMESKKTESVMTSSVNDAERSRANDAVRRAGCDGNGRFASPSAGANAALHAAAQAIGVEPDESVDAMRFRAPQGTTTIRLAWTNKADSFSPVSIENSVLFVSWTKLNAGGGATVNGLDYEVVAYLS